MTDICTHGRQSLSSAIARPDAAIEEVILVDDEDREIGCEEKLAAHRTGALHRAFSVMIWDDEGRMLLQRRAREKYHSGGLWTNACCGHPRPGEDAAAAAARRLYEELGVRAKLAPLGALRYRAELDNGLIEHELVRVFRGRHMGPMAPDPLEVMDIVWMTPDDVARDVADNRARYTAWFQKYLAAGWPTAPA